MKLTEINQIALSIAPELVEGFDKSLIKILQKELITAAKNNEEIFEYVEVSGSARISSEDDPIEDFDEQFEEAVTFELVGEIFHDVLLEYASDNGWDHKNLMKTLIKDKRTMDKVISVMSKIPFKWVTEMDVHLMTGPDDGETFDVEVALEFIPKRFKYNPRKDVVEVSDAKILYAEAQ